MQRVRIRYAKRGRMRFASHRDFARTLERAIRRAEIPIAYSQGFTPHPKISYVGAAPTGVASEAEFLELGLQQQMSLDEIAQRLDLALPDGMDVLDIVEAASGGLSDRIDVSQWQLRLPAEQPEQVVEAVRRFMTTTAVPVERSGKKGMRVLDARGPVVRLSAVVNQPPSGVDDLPCAILDLVVRQVTPTVRPDDVLSGLRAVADLQLSAPPVVVRLAQGALTDEGIIVDPLDADRDTDSGSAAIGAPSS